MLSKTFSRGQTTLCTTSASTGDLLIGDLAFGPATGAWRISGPGSRGPGSGQGGLVASVLFGAVQGTVGSRDQRDRAL